MDELLKKQKSLKRLCHFLLIMSAALLFIYIGVEPFLQRLGSVGIFQIALFVFVLISLAFLFIYQSKYKPIEDYLEKMSFVVSDAGFYLTSREERDVDSYFNAVVEDATQNGYKVEYDKEVNDFVFNAVLSEHNNFIFIIKQNNVDKNDMIAFLDSAEYDLVSHRLKRKGNAVILFICDNADESAILFSKERCDLQITRRGFIHFAFAICDVTTSRVYFLGNKFDKCQQMIANYVMNCDVPVKKDYISDEKLEFQNMLKQELDNTDFKSIKNKIER